MISLTDTWGGVPYNMHLEVFGIHIYDNSVYIMDNRVSIRSANQWDAAYMKKFGIGVASRPTTFEGFFGVPEPDSYGVDLPPDATRRVSNNVSICTNIGPLMDGTRNRIGDIMALDEDSLPPGVRSFYKDLEAIAVRHTGIEDNVDDLARDTMIMLGYDRINPYISIVRGSALKLFISGVSIDVHPDRIVEYNLPTGSASILLIHEDKSIDKSGGLHSALPQLVAEMLAAFTSNRNNITTLTAQDMYGVTLLGTVPTFYKLRVNTTLLDIVEAGIPVEEGVPNRYVVEWCDPVVGNKRIGSGQANIVAREARHLRMYLKSYEAMRRVVMREFNRLEDRLRDSDLSSVD